MPKRRHVEVIEDSILPKALIIGGGHIADYLGNRLIDQGCEIVKEEKPPEKISRFDYIFQFGNWEETNELRKYLKDGGKFLLIETSSEENIDSAYQVRILRAGDLSLWSPAELVDVIFRTIFLTGEKAVADVRKRSKASHHVVEKPVITKKEIPSKIKEAQKPDFRLVEKKSALSIPKIILLLFLFILFSIASSAGYLYWRITILQSDIGKFRSHVASSDWPKAASDLDGIEKEISGFRKIYSFSSKVFFPVRDAPFFKNIGVFISLSEGLVGNTKELLTLLPEGTNAGTSFSMFGRGIDKNEFLRLTGKVRDIEQTVVLAKEQLDGMNLPFFPKDSFSSLLFLTADRLIAINEMIPLFEKILFTEGKRVYLILFQNNMELRPTGGFIGSYGLVTLENGKVLDFKIEDVYTADGQLRGHVDPPLPIRKYLSQPHFFLRDSNFDPDFALSAKQAVFFIQKEMGVTADGVIGVNLFFVQDLLRATGGLFLPDINNEEITADNFFQKAHVYTKDNFFPGSTQKKDFLRATSNAIFEKLGTGREMLRLEILPKVKKALEEKNLMFASSDESVQAMIEQKGFGGRMTEVKCAKAQEQCFPDYLLVIEANLGVNKVNYFINKSVTIEKRIAANGEVLSVLTLAYENSATSEIYPDATYVNYLRVFVPVGSVLRGLSLNNVPVARDDLTVEGYGADKTVFGFPVRITSGNKGMVKITYTLPRLLSPELSSYQLFFQKQGGDKTSPLVLSMLFPKDWNFIPSNFKSNSIHDGEIYYTTDTSVDRIFAVDISR